MGWHIDILISLIYFDASDEGYDIDFGFGILEPSDADLFDVEALQFRVDHHCFLVETVIGVEPQFTLHPLQLDQVPYAIVQQLRVFHDELARLPADAQPTTNQLKFNRNYLVMVMMTLFWISSMIKGLPERWGNDEDPFRCVG